MDDQQAAESRVGSKLRGKWTLDKLLGVGGMAAVYEATHRIGRRDAIKILHPSVTRFAELRERFEQEAHAVNRFAHPGAVEIRDIDAAEDGAPFLVMELLDGEPLSRRFDRKGIAVEELLGYVDELLDVLAAAHAEGIIHRDIKPDNLFVMKNGHLKVLDFGIARMREGTSKATHTLVGTRLGTVPYMPPEQVRGLPIDGRADLFAVGAMMFRLVAGRRVHEAPTEMEMVAMMTTRPAPPLIESSPGTPEPVCLVVDRALAFDKAHRYPDAKTMQEDVRAARHGEPPEHATQMLQHSGPPNTAAAAAAAGAAAAMAGGAVAGVVQRPGRTAVLPTDSPSSPAAPGAPSTLGDMPTAAATPAASAASKELLDMPTAAATPAASAALAQPTPRPPSVRAGGTLPLARDAEAAPAADEPVASGAVSSLGAEPTAAASPSAITGSAAAAAVLPAEPTMRSEGAPPVQPPASAAEVPLAQAPASASVGALTPAVAGPAMAVATPPSRAVLSMAQPSGRDDRNAVLVPLIAGGALVLLVLVALGWWWLAQEPSDTTAEVDPSSNADGAAGQDEMEPVPGLTSVESTASPAQSGATAPRVPWRLKTPKATPTTPESPSPGAPPASPSPSPTPSPSPKAKDDGKKDDKKGKGHKKGHKKKDKDDD